MNGRTERALSLCLRTAATAWLFAGVVIASSLQKDTTAPARYTANAINLDPKVRLTATLVDFTVNRWSTDDERQRLLGIAAEGNQDKLLETLRDIPRVGTFKTPDTQSYDIHYARRFSAEDGGERVVLVTDRDVSIWEAASLSRSRDYPFTVIELRLNASGGGEGKITVATKITSDSKTGQIVLENYGSEPVRLTNVKRDGTGHVSSRTWK